jgi:hypothetical protein
MSNEEVQRTPEKEGAGWVRLAGWVKALLIVTITVNTLGLAAYIPKEATYCVLWIPLRYP